MNFDEQLGIAQRQDAVINYTNGNLVCIAGPGTGKTTSLIKRINNLISIRGISKSNIYYLTFNKEITKAFNKDYFDEFNAEPNTEGEIRTNTLHSLACRLIRNRGYADGFEDALTFINFGEKKDKISVELRKDILQLFNFPGIKSAPQLRYAINKIKCFWQKGQNPIELDPSLQELVEILNKWFISFRVLDWDFTIIEASRLLNEYGLPDWLSNMHHLLIDEYQDFNIAEQLFLQEIIKNSHSTVIVGDDKQSIYSSRGGSPEGLITLITTQFFDQVTYIENLRNPENILKNINLCAQKIQPNCQNLQTNNKGGSIECLEFRTRNLEIDHIEHFLNEKLCELTDTSKEKDRIVCLFPVKKVLNYYFDILKDRIPCSNKNVVFDINRENFRMILSMIENPGLRFYERYILSSLFQVPRRGIKPIIQKIYDQNIDVALAIDQVISENRINEGIKQRFIQFQSFIGQIYSEEPESISNALYLFFPFDKDFIEEKITQFLVDRTDLEDKIDHILDDFFPETATQNDLIRTVSFLTIHGSKGLTRKTVILPGLDQSWLPGKVQEDKIPEMRRLFYVALSRSTETLMITYPKHFANEDPLAFDRQNRGRTCNFVIESGIPIRRINP